MKIILAVIVCGLSCCVYSQISVTSSVYAGIISYLPEEGKIVKKGEPLVRFDTSIIDAQIKEAECEIELAKANYANKCMDLDRSKKITSVISAAAREDIDTDCIVSKITLEKDKHALTYVKALKEGYFINAPYDCKVIKHLAIVNSGTDVGQPILEIVRVDKISEVIQNSSNK